MIRREMAQEPITYAALGAAAASTQHFAATSNQK